MANCWIFQANPDFFLVDEALRTLPEQTWLVQQHRKNIHAGDRVYIWRGGPFAAVLARGVIQTEPDDIALDPAELKLLVNPLRFNGKRCRVRIKTEKFTAPLTKSRMMTEETLRDWYFMQGLEGTNFKVSSEIEAAIERLLGASEGGTKMGSVSAAPAQD